MPVTPLPLNPTPETGAMLKLIPSIVTWVKFVWPRPGKQSVITGAFVTKKVFELVAVPAGVVTEILPVVAPVGTVAWIWVTAVTANVVGLLLNSTLVVPTKLNPSMVTPVFVALRRGEKPEMRGATRKLPLLTPVPVGFVTRICPLVASNGTVAAIRASEVTLKSAIVVSNFTCVAVEKP